MKVGPGRYPGELQVVVTLWSHDATCDRCGGRIWRGTKLIFTSLPGEVDYRHADGRPCAPGLLHRVDPARQTPAGIRWPTWTTKSSGCTGSPTSCIRWWAMDRGSGTVAQSYTSLGEEM